MTRQEEPLIHWDYYRLVVKLEDIAGGLPVDPRLIDAWQQARWDKAKVRPEDPQTVEEAVANSQALVAGLPEEKGWTTFARDHKGHLCLEGRQVKAALKEAANITKTLLPIGGKTVPLRARLAERVFVVERLIPLLPERTEADDVLERAIHVMTAQGPRDALKRTDICKDVELVCTLKVLHDGLFTHGLLKELLGYAGQNGLGADRSQGFGCFDYVLQPATLAS